MVVMYVPQKSTAVYHRLFLLVLRLQKYAGEKQRTTYVMVSAFSARVDTRRIVPTSQ